MVLCVYGFVILWFCGCMVLRFYDFMVSWFRGFMVCGFVVLWLSGFMVYGFMLSKISNFHFMFSGRYRSHIQDFQDFIRRSVGICRRPSFRKLSNKWSSKSLIFIKRMLLRMFQGCFLILLSILLSPKIKIVGFGAWGHVQKSRNHRNEGFWVLP